ncbi:hypothetical protein DPMN_072036 [Dreissena polymorpha]|uniref:C2H2-type domain-containing protein n=1 Tax=Dreissena polymorpha TaxID=45954 RepID=A0A9D4BWL8_DREPO|nr:hypothetical protein DPMN_072036 [Dreissena polymorpha]
MESSGTTRSDDDENSVFSVENIVIKDSEIKPLQTDSEILNDVKMEVEENSDVFKMINSSDENITVEERKRECVVEIDCEEKERTECFEKSNRIEDEKLCGVEKSDRKKEKTECVANEESNGNAERRGKEKDEICITSEYGGNGTVPGVEHCIKYNDTGSEEKEKLIKSDTMEDVSGTENMAFDDDHVVIVETDVRNVDSDTQISDTGEGEVNFMELESDNVRVCRKRLANSFKLDGVDKLESDKSNNNVKTLTDGKLPLYPVCQRKRKGLSEFNFQQEKIRKMLEDKYCEVKEKTIIKMCFKKTKVILKMEKNSKLEKRLITMLENSGKAELSQKDREILAKFSKGHKITFGECSVSLERCDEEHASKTSGRTSKGNLDIDLEMDKEKGENDDNEAEIDTVGNTGNNLDIIVADVNRLDSCNVGKGESYMKRDALDEDDNLETDKIIVDNNERKFKIDVDKANNYDMKMSDFKTVDKVGEVIVKTEKEKVETYMRTGIENDKEIIESDLKKKDNKNAKVIGKKAISELKKGENFDIEFKTDLHKRKIEGGHGTILLSNRSDVDAVKFCLESDIQNAKMDVTGNKCEAVGDRQVKEECMEEDTSDPVGQKAGCEEIKDPNIEAVEESGEQTGEKTDPEHVDKDGGEDSEGISIKSQSKCKQISHESEEESCTNLIHLRSDSVVHLIMNLDTIFTTMKSNLIDVTCHKENAGGVWENIENKLGRVLEKLQMWVLNTNTIDASVSNTAYRHCLTHILDLIIRVDRIFHENDMWVNLLEYLLGETFVALASLYDLINPILPGFVRNQVKDNKGECITFNVNGSNIKFAMDASSLHYLVFVIDKFKKIEHRKEAVRQKRIYMFEDLAYKEQQKQAENNRKEKEALMQQRKEKEHLMMQRVRKQEEVYKEQQKQAENNRKEKEALMQQKKEKELLMMQGVIKQEKAFVDYITQTKGVQGTKQVDGSLLFKPPYKCATNLSNEASDKSTSYAAYIKSSSDVETIANKELSLSPKQSSGSSLGVDSVVENRHSVEKLKTFLDSKVDVNKSVWHDVPAKQRCVFQTVYRLLQKTKSDLYKCYGPILTEQCDNQHSKALKHILSIQGHMLMAFYNRLTVDKQGLGPTDMNILHNLVMLENVELSERLKTCTTSTSDGSSTNSGPNKVVQGATVKIEPNIEEEACLPSTSGIALEKGNRQLTVKTEPTDPAPSLEDELKSPVPMTTGLVSPHCLPLPASLQPSIVGPWFRFTSPSSAAQSTGIRPLLRLNTPPSGVRNQFAPTSGPVQNSQSRAHVVGCGPPLHPFAVSYSNGIIYHIQSSESLTASGTGLSRVGDSTSSSLPKIVNYFSMSNAGQSGKVLDPSLTSASPTSVKPGDICLKSRRLPRVQLSKNFGYQMIKSLDNFVQVKFISRSAVSEYVGRSIGNKIKMYICRVCDWAFDDRDKFKKHFQKKHVHLGMLAVPDLIMLFDFSKAICGVCGETNDHHVQSHFSKEEQEVRYVCTMCTKQRIKLYFETKEQLVKHSWFHQRGQKRGPTICLSCGNIFWHKSLYHLHQILSERCGLNLAHLHNVENQVPIKLGYITKSTAQDGVNVVKEQLEILREKKEHLIALREKLMNKKSTMGN